MISNADVTHLVRVRQLRLRLPYVASVGTEGRKARVISYVTIGTNDSHSSRLEFKTSFWDVAHRFMAGCSLLIIFYEDSLISSFGREHSAHRAFLVSWYSLLPDQR